MQLPDVKALEKLIKMLRSQGVTHYNTPDLALNLLEAPPQSVKRMPAEESEERELSPEEEAERLLFYSATPATNGIES